MRVLTVPFRSGFSQIVKSVIVLGAPVLFVAVVVFSIPLEIARPRSGDRFVTSYMRYRAINTDRGTETLSATWIPLDQVSPVIVCALIKAEDRHFFRHHGFDRPAIHRAITKRFDGAPLIGASTISQQVARNLYLTPTRSWWRKLREAWLTARLERTYTKRELLELYVNAIEWGEEIWGIEAASQFYFQKKPSELGLTESLYLAGIIANPRQSQSSEELSRIIAVATRVNAQLRNSRLYPQTTFESAQSAINDYKVRGMRGDSANGALRGLSVASEKIALSLDDVIGNQCGLGGELGE